jgi:ADP-heptose:LPS heptosyltransferase
VIQVAAPPGVGDVYWVLTKLKAWKAANGGQPVRLLVQACGELDRAGQWRDMVDFVEDLRFYPFKPDRAALETGLGRLPTGAPILWPNAVVDRGRPLAEWLPDLELDLSFPVRTTPVPGGPRTVLYVSSDAINRAWMAHLPAGYWYDVVAELNKAVGRVTIIGAKWDRPFFDRWLREAPRALDVENLVQSTTLMQVADLIKHARFFVGVISGMTILANHFRTPCFAIYPTAHNDAFPRTWVAPEAPYWPTRADRVPQAAELGELVRAGAREVAA